LTVLDPPQAVLFFELTCVPASAAVFLDLPPQAAAGEGPLLADYKEHHTDVSVHFDVDLVPGKLAALTAAAGGLEAKFKLSSKISTGVRGVRKRDSTCVCAAAARIACEVIMSSALPSRLVSICAVIHHVDACDAFTVLGCRPAGNMMLFDAEGHIKRYDSPEDILREFFDLRLQFYERRRVGMLQVRLGMHPACTR
jgi:hypothetical protein